MIFMWFYRINILLIVQKEFKRAQQMQKNNNQKKEVKIGKQKRVDLAKQFDDFKQKIQEFQDKNQRILNRIREAYTFKKKAMEQQPPQYPATTHNSRVVYYDRGDEADSVASSCDYSKNAVYDGNLMPSSNVPQNSPYQSYPSNEQLYFNSCFAQESRQMNNYQQQLYKGSNIYSKPQLISKANEGQNIYPNYSEYIKIQQGVGQPINELQDEQRRRTGKFNAREDEQLLQRLREATDRNRELEEQIGEKEQEIQRIKGVQVKFKSYANSLRRMVADQFQNYHEEVILQKFLELEKYFKKCDNRLKNLSLRLKDAIQDRRASTVIQRSRSRRRSTAKQECKQSEVSSCDMKDSWVSGPNRETARVPKRKGQVQQKSMTLNQNKQKEFAEIAAGYQNMINAKAQEIQKLEKQVRQEVAAREQYAEQLARARIMLEEKQRIAEELNRPSKTLVREEGGEERQMKELRQKVIQLQNDLKVKDQKQKDLNGALQRMQKAKKSLLQEQKESYSKNLTKKTSTISDLQQKLKECESIYLKEIGEMKDRIIVADKKVMEKECEILTLSNKLKKTENDCLLNEQKVKQLESLITKDTESDLLEKSISGDTSILTNTQIKSLHEVLRRLEDENDKKIIIIEELQKDKFRLEMELSAERDEKGKLAKGIQGLEKKVIQLQREGEESSSERDAGRQLQEKIVLLEECQRQREELLEEKEELVSKSSRFLQELKKLKEQNLSLSRDLIKVNSQLNFKQGEYSNLEQKLSRCKEEAVEAKARWNDQAMHHEQKQKELTTKIGQLKLLIEQYQQTIIELEGTKFPEDKEEEILLTSMHVSEISFNLAQGKGAQEEELVSLRERVKEVEATLEVKEAMEMQIQGEYKSNLQRIRMDIADKNTEIQKLQLENGELKKQIKAIQEQHQDEASFENIKVSVYEQKIMQLEVELNSYQESEKKLNDLLHQFTDAMKQKQEERLKLLGEVEQKDKALEELKQLMDIKELKEINKEPLSKDLSLRASGDHSEEMSDMAEVSYFSNISDVFKRDDVLQQKMKRGKTSREEFIRLFTKTSAYIKSLKGIIESKDKRIRILQRQLSSLKFEDKNSWSGGKEQKIVQARVLKTENEDSIEEYKDYDSVQIDTRRSKSYDIIKELHHEKALAIEENKMLLNQIELLQDQLQRAEEQQNSLVKIKDLYKDEIRKLMQNNECHTQEFQIQIKKLREELDQSESYHNWEALKQLFVKMIGCVGCLQEQTNRSRREEKRKELQEFVKVVSSILRLQMGVRDKLISSIRK